MLCLSLSQTMSGVLYMLAVVAALIVSVAIGSCCVWLLRDPLPVARRSATSAAAAGASVSGASTAGAAAAAAAGAKAPAGSGVGSARAKQGDAAVTSKSD